MKIFQWILLNAAVLIGFGLWAYFSSDAPSATAFIPVGLGVLQLLLLPGMTKGKVLFTRLMIVLCVLIIGGLVKPLLGSLDREGIVPLVRVSVMMFMTITSFVLLIRK